MEFKKLEKKVIKNAIRYGKKYGVKIDEDFALFKLYEEVGELAQDVLIHRKKCRPEKYLSEKESKKELAKEIADTLGMLMVVAYLLDIDLEEAVTKKWITREWVKNEKNH
ncbi:MAG: MazG nucleotide pyrophosphohydrolase domain-containing protein [Candidatus Pacebacteria bacterium]|nr:MazG nucleotide pyrophosphohydrolase domain-containing protein [Candidatus Paceibacterota bacterium]